MKRPNLAGARANAGRIVRSLRLLQRRFGKQHGQGSEVELWHALDDLARIAGEVETDLSQSLDRAKPLEGGIR